MSFINSIGNVATHRKQFKQWEKEEKNKNAKREELTNKKPPSEDELRKAQAKGEVIMNIIDASDTYSEEVSENVETTVMPLAQIGPMGLTGAAALLNYKFNCIPADRKYAEAVNQFNKSANGEKLRDIAKQIKAYKNAKPGELKKLGYFEYSPTQLFGKRQLKALSECNDESIKECYKELLNLKNKYVNIPDIKNLNKRIGLAVGITGGVLAASYVLFNVLAAKLQVHASRVARWQSRQDLSDPKYFVQYTEEQKASAKENLANKKAEEKKPLFSFGKNGLMQKRTGYLKSLSGIVKDNKKYSEWKKNYNNEDKKVQRELTTKELELAKKDQELIQRITRQINNNAEEYGENMETAAGVLIGGTPFLGAGVGAIVNFITNRTGLGEKAQDKAFKKLLGKMDEHVNKDDLKKIYENIKKAANIKNASFSQKVANIQEHSKLYSELLYGVKEQGCKAGIGATVERFRNVLDIINTTKLGRNIKTGLVGAMITGIAGAFIGLKLQKSASRVGRFQAKREIENNPNNFIGYSDEELNSVGDVKVAKESALKKLGNYVTFLPRSIKQYFDYQHYKKTEGKQEKELLDELVKTANPTKEQLDEAKDLQRKVFLTFENVDDKSQEYSESVEAVTEMAQPLIPYLGIAVASLPILIGGIKLYKGGGANVAEKVSKFFAKHTEILKGKFVSKYADDVCSNMRTVVENKEVKDTVSKFASKMNLPEGFLKNIDLDGITADFKKLSPKLKDGETSIKTIIEDLSQMESVKKLSKEDLKTLFDNLIDYANISKVDDYVDLNEFKSVVSNVFETSSDMGEVITKVMNKVDIPDIKIKDVSNLFSDFASQFGDAGKELKSVLSELKNSNLSGIMKATVEGQIKNGNWRKAAQELADSTSGTTSEIINSILRSKLTDEQAAKIFNNLVEVTKNIPAEQLKKIVDTALDEFKKNPDKFMVALADGSFKKILVTKGLVKTGALVTGTWTALSLFLSFVVESNFASMQKKAGRLGVMSALEELKDPNYYANENSATFAGQYNAPVNQPAGQNQNTFIIMDNFLNSLNK